MLAAAESESAQSLIEAAAKWLVCGPVQVKQGRWGGGHAGETECK